MAESGLRSPRAQIAVAVLAVLALAVLYWQFIYASLAEDEQRQARLHKKLQTENKDLTDEERIQTDMLKCKPELDALNRENELMLPALAEPVAFLKNLSGMAAAAGLEQGATKMMAEAEVQAPAQTADDKRTDAEGKVERRPGEAVPCWEKVSGLTAAGADKASFVRVPFVIEVRGTFHQLMRYFWMVHQHGNTGRIITIEDLSLTNPAAGADGIVMTAKFTAVGFREPDSAARPAPDVETARSGRAQVRDATAKREAQVEAASAAEGSASPSTPATPPTSTPAGTAEPPPAGTAEPPPAATAEPPPAATAESGAERITNPGAP